MPTTVPLFPTKYLLQVLPLVIPRLHLLAFVEPSVKHPLPTYLFTMATYFAPLATISSWGSGFEVSVSAVLSGMTLYHVSRALAATHPAMIRLKQPSSGMHAQQT